MNRPFARAIARMPQVAAVFAFLAIGSPAVHAHAVILTSEPKAGAVVSGSVLSLQLKFNSRIDANHSRLLLQGPDGQAIPLEIEANKSVDEIDATVRALKSGPYRLHWQVMSVDGHITRGDLPFTVAP